MAENKFIFISYSHKDTKVVYPIIEALKKKNFNVWYDNGIEAGSEWPEYIAGKIVESAVVLVLLSKNALESHNCRREITYAIKLQKEMLVAYLEDMQLPPGMDMQLTILQDIKKNNFVDDESFCSALAGAKILQPCKNVEKIEVTKASESYETTKKTDDFFGLGLNYDDILKEIPKEIPKEKEERVPASFSVEKVVEEFNLTSKHKLLSRDELKNARIKNALKYVAEDSGETEKDVVAFRDMTILDSGKEGFLLTKTALYYKYFGSSFAVKYSDIKGTEKTDSSTNFCLNSGSVVGIANTNLFDLYSLTEILLKHKGIKNTDFESLVKQGDKIHCAVAHANKAATGNYFDENSGLFFVEMVSEKQKKNAVKHVANNYISTEQIVAFADLTVMKSGKEGVVVTAEGLYYKYVGDSYYIDFENLVSVREEKGGRKIVVRLKNDELEIGDSLNHSRTIYEFLQYIVSRKSM